MDDEELVRKVAGELLRILGHEVELAEHGEAALGKYRSALQAGKRFDLVILDLTIRGGSGGAETMRELLRIDPGAQGRRRRAAIPTTVSSPPTGSTALPPV